jgi:hypothetical protein
MSRIEIRAEAERDVFDAALWYEQERAGLGFRFEVEVTDLLARITDHPLCSSRRWSGASGAPSSRSFPMPSSFDSRPTWSR